MANRRSQERTPRRSGMSRRDFLKYSGAGVAGATLLSACAGFGGSDDDDAGGAKSLLFTHGPDESGSIQALLDEFSKSSGIKIEWREMPADTGQYFDKLRSEFEAGSGDIDVISGDVIWPAQFAANGYIADLSDRLSDDLRGQILEGALQANIYQEKVYGVPWFTDAGMLYYRKDLLDEAGGQPPTTWDDLKQMATDIQKSSGTKFGMVFQGAAYEGGVCNGSEYIWTHGGDILDPEDASSVIIDSSESAAGMGTYQSLVSEGISPEDVVNYTETETHTTFLRGDAVFARNWPYMYGLAADPEISKIKPEQIGVVALPSGEGGETAATLGGWNLFINASSSNQEDAWKLIQFLASEEAQKKKALKGAFLPTVESLYDDKEIIETIPVVELGKEALLNVHPRPVSPFYSDISLKLQQRYNECLKGDSSPEETVATLQEEIQAIIDQGA